MKMNLEEVEEPETTRITTKNEHPRSWRAERAKKYEFYCENPVEDHPRPTKNTRITTKNEHRRTWRTEKCGITTRNPFQTLSRASQNTGKYENYHEKWTYKKLKSRKLRKFTCKTRSRRSPPPQKHENYHEKRTSKHENTKIATHSVRHLRSSTPAFYYYRKNPKCEPHCLGKKVQKYAKKSKKICNKYAKNMQNIRKKYAKNMQKICIGNLGAGVQYWA